MMQPSNAYNVVSHKDDRPKNGRVRESSTKEYTASNLCSWYLPSIIPWWSLSRFKANMAAFEGAQYREQIRLWSLRDVSANLVVARCVICAVAESYGGYPDIFGNPYMPPEGHPFLPGRDMSRIQIGEVLEANTDDAVLEMLNNLDPMWVGKVLMSIDHVAHPADLKMDDGKHFETWIKANLDALPVKSNDVRTSNIPKPASAVAPDPKPAPSDSKPSAPKPASKPSRIGSVLSGVRR